MPTKTDRYVFGVEGYFLITPSRHGAHNWEVELLYHRSIRPCRLINVTFHLGDWRFISLLKSSSDPEDVASISSTATGIYVILYGFLGKTE
jgi:hypothetical protein